MFTTSCFPFHVRHLIRRELNRCVEIANACYEHPTTAAQFESTIKEHAVIGVSACLGTAPRDIDCYCHPRDVIGFMLYELRPGFYDIIDICVDPDYRRHGIGRRFFDILVQKCFAQRRSHIRAVVSEFNDDAIAFLRSVGMKGSGIEREHYPNGDDGYLFELYADDYVPLVID